MQKSVYILLSFLLAACQSGIITDYAPITECAPMPEARAAATSFVCGGKAYVFGGRTQDGVCQNTIWRYDPATDTWTAIGGTPLLPRLNATACVLNDTVYIGLGFNGGHIYTDSCYLRDFWQYVPATDIWIRLPDFPTNETNKCISFVHNDNLYIGCGYYSFATCNMYRYNRHDSIWTQQKISSLQHPETAFSMVGATCGNRHFTGTGFTLQSQTQWLEYLPDKARFVKMTSMPDKGRDRAAAAASEKYVYVCGGQRFGGTLTSFRFYDDVMRFNPAVSTWTRAAIMPYGGAIAMTTFAIDGKVYFGLGEDINGQLKNNIYRIDE